MKDEHLDHIIKEKMEGLQFPFEAENWDLFVEKLEESEGGPAAFPAQEFDAQVFDKVNDFQASSLKMDQHWSLFEQQLNQLLNVRELLLRYKFAEMALMVLLLLFVGSWNTQTLEQPNELKPVLPQEQSTPLQSPPVASLESSNTIDQDINNAEVSSINKNEVAEKENSANPSQAALIAQSVNAPQENTAIAETSSSNKHTTQSLILPLLNTVESEQLASSSTKADELEYAPANEIEATYNSDLILALESTSSLLTWTPTENILDKELQIKPRYNTQITMAGGGEVNQIITPQNEENSINENESFSFGYRGGLTMDFGRGNSPFRFGSGLIYTAKQYNIGKTFINGSVLRSNLTAEELDNVELNIINVPVFARYRFMEKKRWSMFAQAGLSVQMAMQANYYVETPNFRRWPAPANLNNIRQTPSSQSKFENRNDGLLEGGNFRENSFFTVNMSFGLERLMTDRFSLFFQPQYEYSVGGFSSGLGPTKDRFNTFSFESGVRVRLR